MWSEGRSEQLSLCTCSTSEQKERLLKHTDSVPPIWISPFVLCIGGSRAAGEERGSSLSVRQRRCSSATLTVCRAQSPFDRDPRGVSPLSRRVPLQQKGKRNSWEDHLFHLRWPFLGEKHWLNWHLSREILSRKPLRVTQWKKRSFNRRYRWTFVTLELVAAVRWGWDRCSSPSPSACTSLSRISSKVSGKAQDACFICEWGCLTFNSCRTGRQNKNCYILAHHRMLLKGTFKTKCLLCISNMPWN